MARREFALIKEPAATRCTPRTDSAHPRLVGEALVARHFGTQSPWRVVRRMSLPSMVFVAVWARGSQFLSGKPRQVNIKSSSTMALVEPQQDQVEDGRPQANPGDQPPAPKKGKKKPGRTHHAGEEDQPVWRRRCPGRATDRFGCGCAIGIWLLIVSLAVMALSYSRVLAYEDCRNEVCGGYTCGGGAAWSFRDCALTEGCPRGGRIASGNITPTPTPRESVYPAVHQRPGCAGAMLHRWVGGNTLGNLGSL